MATLFAALPAVLSGRADGAPPVADRTGLDVTRHELRNGMRFLIVPFGDAPVVATLLNVHVGGVDDPKGQPGSRTCSST